ncbi:MAG: ABC transporter permease, partial [Pseudomonadota bacterium]
MADVSATANQGAAAAIQKQSRAQRIGRFVKRNPTMVLGGGILVFMALAAAFAPFYAGDARLMQPIQRLRPPSAEHWFGTDALGREVFARTVYGAQVSLFVGVAVAVLAIGFGLVIGLLSGFFRKLDAVIMRVMDGLMAIPSILLAIALVALTQSSVLTVVVAIAIPEIPRVVRLVRSVVLGVREAPYVEAAVASGTPTITILVRHILPNTTAP